jgi:4-amino-4-deoxy-L-arabinose transferase-like glycosyltransferase
MDKKDIFLLLVIVLVGVFFRSWNLESIPRWDWDEGVNLDIANNLADGRMQWACLSYPFVPHPPFFFMLVATAVKLFGSGLLVERSLTAFFGVSTAVFVYLLGRELFDRKAALLAGLLYALYPSAIYFSRIGFANNLLTLLLVSCMYFFVRYLRDRRLLWFILSVASAGLSTITEIQGFCTVAALMVLFWVYDKKNLAKAVVGSMFFFAVFVVVMLNLMHDAFIADALYSSGRFNLLAAFIAMALVGFFVFKPACLSRLYGVLLRVYMPVFDEIKQNPAIFIILFVLASAIIVLLPPSDDFFFAGFDFQWIGVAGFLLMAKGEQRNIIGVFFLVYFIALLGFDRADHMLIPLHPLLSLGLGFLFSMFFKFSVAYFGSRFTWSTALFISVALIVYPMLAMAYYDVDMFVNGNWIRMEDTRARATVADYINSNTLKGDVVIVDSHLTRMIDAQPTVLVQSVAFDGHAVEFIRPDYGRSRFLADCSYRNAKFIVMGNGTFEEIRNKSAFVDLLVGIDGWPSREVAGFVIYRNPSLS